MKPQDSRLFSSVFIVAGMACAPCWAQSVDQGSIELQGNPCSAYGEGFVVVEGTQTCIRVSGHVRVEMDYGRPMRFERPSPLATPQADWRAATFPQRVEGAIPAELRFDAAQAR